MNRISRFRFGLVAASMLILWWSMASTSQATDPADGISADARNLEVALKQYGAAVDTESLITQLTSDPSWYIRSTSVELLAIRLKADALETLVAALENEQDSRVLESLGTCLLELGDEQGAEVLEPMLDTVEDLSRKVKIASELAKFGDRRGFDYLLEAIRKEESYFRLQGTRSLKFFVTLEKDPEGISERAINAMLSQADDSDSFVRLNALINLPLGHQSVDVQNDMATLLRSLALLDSDKDVREKAQQKLRLWCDGVLSETKPPADHCR